MKLPSALRDAIEQERSRVDRSGIARAAEQITADYKAGRFGGSLASPESRAAYLLARVPATYAANAQVFREIARLMPGFAPVSMLDLGAGPGTASWAAVEKWDSLREIVLIEGNREMLETGSRLAQSSDVLQAAQWVHSDLRSATFPPADIVVLSYAIGELGGASARVNSAWAATKEILVVVEPGTPRNFDTLAQIRRELISKGAYAVAPCPHENECPMYAAADWCHFAVRLERTAEHRRLKGGTLGYEDEKFSYLAFSKNQSAHAVKRIVRHPLTYSGHIKLTLCTAAGLENDTVTKSQKERFRVARRAKWGDEWDQFE